jgi:hypothetical protein
MGLAVEFVRLKPTPTVIGFPGNNCDPVYDRRGLESAKVFPLPQLELELITPLPIPIPGTLKPTSMELPDPPGSGGRETSAPVVE